MSTQEMQITPLLSKGFSPLFRLQPEEMPMAPARIDAVQAVGAGDGVALRARERVGPPGAPPGGWGGCCWRCPPS